MSESISRFCFGCEALGGTDWGEVSLDEIERCINIAIANGVNFFDTAAIYGLGLSEERLAAILGKRRSKMFIATKGGLVWSKSKNKRAKVWKDSSANSIRKGIIQSLKNLKLEYIPLFYIHWPDLETDFEETFYTLRDLQKEGLIKYIGCSNFSKEELIKVSQFCKIDFLQAPFNFLIDHPKELFSYCRNNAIKFVAYNVLSSGLLTGKYNEDYIFDSNDRRSRLYSFKRESILNSKRKLESLKFKAKKHNLSMTQYSIKYICDNENIFSTILGIKNVEQLKENIEVFKHCMMKEL
ncbi:aldo/keto reductase [Prochlorococcus marinus]|uniref:Aldo/keto reductase n=1 Tax=Prochlorococcus marinus str. GP2 TaxID=59925 RepID=A0A0A1ZAJ7_PROMR|nr:aldo/keto reductase [Prochlorococcus marinus]KGF86485.1 aldo/keto reductase [Prochlorococcus marinus str. GP2]